MYLMYVDESGDSGLVRSPTRYFVLTGIVLHELRWRDTLDNLITFRKAMRNSFGLKLREEFHAAKLVNNPKELVRIKRHHRLEMIKLFAETLAKISDLNIINVVVDKQGKNPGYDVFENAWKALIQRFENTMSYRNFRGPANPDDRGMIICDHTQDKKLFSLVRKMRLFNPIPNQPQFGSGYRNLTLNYIVEDPSFRDSRHSYFVQAADLAAFLIFQHFVPNSYIRKNSAKNYFLKLQPIFCTHASASDPHGIVRL